ncbi:Fur family transcriptional regulator [Nitrospira moscoviensis]|uniref:Ferric uptake regulation protein n=1 Tax=Nitrospira moscoviensis TaxID=42253 RepID=A0A0K2GEP7_NITMO|nr:Fur family transcriptional regulator [Nitrospira moscoviensis]ALA59420.1 Peroxide operon regulator [Nitrospira moscoviensis]
MKTPRDVTTAHLQQRFQEKGLKLTPQRLAIYQMLMNTEAHPTADDIYHAVKPTFPMLSLNTVYYTLTAFKEAGLVWEVPVEHASSRYDANMDQHHHLVCLDCGKIEDLYDESLVCLRPPTANQRGFDIRMHRVEFRGYCEACRAKQGASQDTALSNRSMSQS